MSIRPVSVGQPPPVPQVSSPSSPLGGPNNATNSDSTSNIQKAISNAQKMIANELRTTNDNGTITVTTAYTDGTTSTVTNANPPRPTISQNPLAANSGQLATLLQAQQESTRS